MATLAPFQPELDSEEGAYVMETSCLVPLPKKPDSADPKDCRPKALTSHEMKVLVRLVLAHLSLQVRPVDPSVV